MYVLPTMSQAYPTCTGNHNGIASAVGYRDVREYRYYKKETRDLDFEGMVQDIKACHWLIIVQSRDLYIICNVVVT